MDSMTSSVPNIPADDSWKRTLYIMSLAHMLTAIGFSSVFPFLPLYVKSLGAASAVSIELLVGLVFSGQAAAMMVAAPLWGALADRWGRKLMVERAMFGGAVVIGLMGFVRSAEELVLLRVLQGMITGTIGAANALVAGVVPRGRMGYAMGMLQVALGCGIGIGPVIGGVLADAFGYRAAFYVTGGLLTIGGFIVYFGVQERFTAPMTVGRPVGLWKEFRHVLSTPGVVWALGLGFLNQLGRIIFIPILPLFIYGLVAGPERVNSVTGIVIGTSSAATALFAVFLGRMGDAVGHGRVLVASLWFCVACFLLQSLVTAAWHLLVLQALFGVALGGIVPGISSLLAQYTRQGEEGAVYGLDSSILSGARAVGPMVGVGVAMWLGFRAVFVTGALLYLIAALIAARTLTRRTA